MQLQKELTRYDCRHELAGRLRFRDPIAYGLIRQQPFPPAAVHPRCAPTPYGIGS
ncbi:hypothetical protein ABZ671_17320 [Micromonospora sp. NPDC006766]|uniref:hypothetical protein n=1 Tax=Micromonospora sp. NPDC006766 TaxID=3154778 RepID=UPI0033CC8DFD